MAVMQAEVLDRTWCMDPEPPEDEERPAQRKRRRPCTHPETVEFAVTSKPLGRFSIGNEYIEERCIHCGERLGGYWTGGVF